MTVQGQTWLYTSTDGQYRPTQHNTTHYTPTGINTADQDSRLLIITCLIACIFLISPMVFQHLQLCTFLQRDLTDGSFSEEATH